MVRRFNILLDQRVTNIHLRGIAKARGIKINEYGAFKERRRSLERKRKMSIVFLNGVDRTRAS